MSDTHRLLRPIKRKSGLPLAEREAQIAALPAKTNFCNIYPDYEWLVVLCRKGLVFRKHFRELSDAVWWRDQLWQSFETQRRLELVARKLAKEEKRKSEIARRNCDSARLLAPTIRPSGLTYEERKQQIDAVPPGTDFCNIYPDHGWRVMMRRRNHLYFGGHFMDLTEAVAGRDRMWAKYEGNLSGSEPDT